MSKKGKATYPKGQGAHPNRWQPAAKAKKLPNLKGKSEDIQQFVVWAAEQHTQILIHKNKNGFSLHHPDHRKHIISFGGSPTTLRMTSRFFDPDKDVGCDGDSKGAPTIVIEDPEKDDVIRYTKLVIGRAQLPAA